MNVHRNNISSPIYLKSVRAPSDIVITPRVLGCLLCKLTTEMLRSVLEIGHNELDRRESDPDIEPDAVASQKRRWARCKYLRGKPATIPM
jgi:hypothetical protein